jgi:hypothetical protein
MNQKEQKDVFDIIHDKAAELLNYNSPEEVKKGLNLIISLSRYKTDVRTTEEKNKSRD